MRASPMRSSQPASIACTRVAPARRPRSSGSVSAVGQNVVRGHSRGNQYSGRCRVSTAQTRGSELLAVSLTCGANAAIVASSLTCQSSCGPSPAYGGAGSRTTASLVVGAEELRASASRLALYAWRVPAQGLSPELRVRTGGSPVLRTTTVYAVANQKGGVGKTTTAVNLSACLAEAGERVLLIDLDPQANATSGLGMRANGASTHDLLDGVPLAKLASVPNLDVVMAKSDLAAAAVELSSRDGGERYLADALADALEAYSYV